MRYDEKGDLQGVLSSEWSSKQGNAVWVFHLRQGVKFHNGKEMSAEDVLWSVNYVMDPDNGAGGYGVLSRTVKEVKSTGKYTVEFALKTPDALFPESIEGLEPITVIPANSLAPKTVKVGSQPPPGTGPFKFASWTAGQDLTVEGLMITGEDAPILTGSPSSSLPRMRAGLTRCAPAIFTSLSA